MLRRGFAPVPYRASYSQLKPSAQYIDIDGAPTVTTGLPLSDAAAAALVTAPAGFEPRPANATANATAGPASHAALNLGPWLTDTYWAHSAANSALITGNFTGTTSQIIQWAAWKWGLDEDVFRAQAAEESWWTQSTEGDLANGLYHSYGLMQVRDCPDESTTLDHSGMGGMPYTQNSTAVACDIAGAWIRSAFDGAFYDGGDYLYGGQTVGQVAAAHDWNYVMWGCVAFWFSGGWYPWDTDTTNYVNNVQYNLTNRVWEQPGF